MSASTLIAVPLFAAAPAFADCQPDPAASGQTVTCSGADTNGFTAGAGVNNLTINVLSGASVSTTGARTIQVNGQSTVINAGTVTTGTFTGIAADFGLNNLVINTGTIVGGGNGIEVNGNFSTLPLVANNSGLISLNGGFVTGIFANNGSVVNSGTIIGTGSTFGSGVRGNVYQLTNTGQIIAIGPGASVQAVGFGGGLNSLLNSGSIIAISTTGGAAEAVNGPVTLLNSGLIRGAIDTAIFAPPPITNLAGGRIEAANAFGAMIQTNGLFTNAPGATVVPRATTTPGTFDTIVGSFGNSSLVLNGTYLVALQPGLYANTTFDPNAVQVNGTRTGAFDTVTTTSAFIGATLTPGAGQNLDLTLTRIPFGSVPGETQNQRAVGAALEPFYATTLTGNVATFFLDLLSAPSVGALTQISGETATGSQQTTFDAMSQFLGVLTDPFITGRGDMTSAGGTPNAYTEDEALAYSANGKKRSNSERNAYAAMATKAPPAVAAPLQRWSVWAAGFGGTRRLDGDPIVLGSNNTRSEIVGGAAGADYRFSPNTIAGFALAGAGTRFNVDAFGSGRSDVFQAGAFVRHTVGPAYISAALAYGWQDVTTDRTVTVAGFDQLRAKFNANALSGRAEAGYRFLVPMPVLGGNFGLTPYAAGQFTTFWLPSYVEQAIVGTNMFALAYASKTVTDTRSELGFRTDKSYAFGNAIVTLRGRTAWAHDFNVDRSISATFQTLPGATFVVNGARQPRDSLLSSTSVEIKWMNGWSVAGTFDSEYAKHLRSYAGKGVVRYQW